jgi:hypothetical protein
VTKSGWVVDKFNHWTNNLIVLLYFYSHFFKYYPLPMGDSSLQPFPVCLSVCVYLDCNLYLCVFLSVCTLTSIFLCLHFFLFVVPQNCNLSLFVLLSVCVSQTAIFPCVSLSLYLQLQYFSLIILLSVCVSQNYTLSLCVFLYACFYPNCNLS